MEIFTSRGMGNSMHGRRIGMGNSMHGGWIRMEIQLARE